MKFGAGGLIEQFDAKRTAVSGNYTVLSTDFLIGVTSTSSAYTVTFPTAIITAQAGRMWIIFDESGLAGTNNITIATEASETVNGNASVAIDANYEGMILYSDGSNLFGFEISGAA